MSHVFDNLGPRNAITPQNEPIPDSRQVPNSAGGYSFALDKWKQLERFLILGTEGGTYYIDERNLTLDNVQSAKECLAEDGLRVVAMVTDISDRGRAPKNNPALLVLAMAAADKLPETRAAALEALPKVARIGTHLFQFAGYVEQFRGWGRNLKHSVARWYLDKDPSQLALQLAKYQQRDGWSHRDMLRLAKPKGAKGDVNTALRWAVGKDVALEENGPLHLLAAFEQAKGTDKATEIVRLIQQHQLPRECIPTQWLNNPEVWAALLEQMPLHALVRNLGKMTAIELIKPLSSAEQQVVMALRDRNAIRKSRLHPLAVLIAAKQYATGHGDKGKLTWNPSQSVIDALDQTFTLAFENVEPTGKRFYLGVDVSGSMDWAGSCGAGTTLTAREGAAALAMQIARTEERYVMRGFSHGMVDLGITAKNPLHLAMEKMRQMPMDGTDCALPILDAMKYKLEVDCFVVLTDSETWTGRIHPTQALRDYRKQTGIPAKMIVVGMQANPFTIADPKDAGMLDIVGFDASMPAILAQFMTD